jgi:virginiamycin A acetyltransferase
MSNHGQDVTAIQEFWAGLPAWARGGRLGKWINPSNLTRIHLAHLIRRHGHEIGAASYGRPKLRFPAAARLRIGRYCSIADGVEILLGGNHRTDWITTYPFPEFGTDWPDAAMRTDHHASKGDVAIGHDVWLGSQAMVLSGVTIGHGAVIAARSVVARDVPPYAIVAGNPAKIIRMRFSEADIAGLLAVQWWHWPNERIGKALPLMMSGDVSAFLAYAGEATSPRA